MAPVFFPTQPTAVVLVTRRIGDGFYEIAQPLLRGGMGKGTGLGALQARDPAIEARIGMKYETHPMLTAIHR